MMRLAAASWVALALYPLSQLVVAWAWQPAYSWSHDYISSLGNTACGMWGERFVCSPLHPLMNAAFVITGLLMVFGGVLFARAYADQKLLLIGFGLQALGGIGAIIVGLVPENSASIWHGIGAALPFLGGNAGLVLLGVAARWPAWVRRITVAAGCIGLVALGLFIAGEYVGLGRGGLERVVDGIHIGWMILFGLLVIRAKGRPAL